MQISLISDIHIQASNEKKHSLLLKFLNHPKVKKSDAVVLLGDIFDLMVGEKKAYLNEYEEAFQTMEWLCKSGVELYFVEGNHDFHLEKTFSDYFSFVGDRFHYIKDQFSLNYGDKKILFCHGDLQDVENESYQRYQKVIKSSLVNFIARCTPHFLIKYVGENASNASRERNQDKYSLKYNSPEVKEYYRRIADRLSLELSWDILVCGHSHVKDHYVLKNGKEYYNNGFAPAEKTFLYFSEVGISFEPL